jgi:carboxyl-terminal processing protease
MPTTRDLLRAAALAALAALLAARAAEAQGTGARPVSADLAAATFDSAWARIRDTHYDPGMRGLDWNAVRRELRPRAERAGTIRALRAVLGDMLARLGESHFAIIPQEAAEALDPGRRTDAAGDEPGDVGVALALVGGDVVVARVEPGSPAAAAGVHSGWVLDSVGAFGRGRVREALARLTTPAARRQAEYRLPVVGELALEGAAGSPAHATFLDGRGRAVAVTMRRRATPGAPIKFGNLPTFLARLERERLPLPGAGGAGACAGVIRFNIWMPPLAAAIDSAVREVRGCRGVVLDLRGNPGGVAAMVMGASGYFLDSVQALGVMRARGTELRFNSVPRRVDDQGTPTRPYAGPLAILVDERTASTSEIFAAGMQAVGRARLFGTPSSGQALPALATRLQTGDVMMHVVADFVAPDGRRIEGHGAIPDEATPLTREALLAGHDPALEAAVRWITTAGSATP